MIPVLECPDGGTCHHECFDDSAWEGTCQRVWNAAPLSGVFPDDKWPHQTGDTFTVDDVRADNPQCRVECDKDGGRGCHAKPCRRYRVPVEKRTRVDRTSDMPGITQDFLMIMSLDPEAAISFSEYTGQWYVQARIEVGDGDVLQGMTEHRDTPEDAVNAYMARLKEINYHQATHFLVTRRFGDRRQHWRWNGVTFMEEPVPETVQLTRKGS